MLRVYRAALTALVMGGLFGACGAEDDMVADDAAARAARMQQVCEPGTYYEMESGDACLYDDAAAVCPEGFSGDALLDDLAYCVSWSDPDPDDQATIATQASDLWETIQEDVGDACDDYQAMADRAFLEAMSGCSSDAECRVATLAPDAHSTCIYNLLVYEHAFTTKADLEALTAQLLQYDAAYRTCARAECAGYGSHEEVLGALCVDGHCELEFATEDE